MEFQTVNPNPQLTKENLNKLPNMQPSVVRPNDSISNVGASQVRTQIFNSISRKIDQTKVRNYCPKHKLVFVNKCLQDGVNLCADCFKHHKDHKLEMLQNIASEEIQEVQRIYQHIENSIA
jgi:hypothetical protein